MFSYTKGFYSLLAFTVREWKKQTPKDFTLTHTKFSVRKHNMDIKSSARDKVLVTPARGWAPACAQLCSLCCEGGKLNWVSRQLYPPVDPSAKGKRSRTASRSRGHQGGIMQVAPLLGNFTEKILETRWLQDVTFDKALGLNIPRNDHLQDS